MAGRRSMWVINARIAPSVFANQLFKDLCTQVPEPKVDGMTSILIEDMSPMAFTSCRSRSRPSVWWRDEPGIRSLSWVPSMRSGPPDIASPRETRPTTVFLHREDLVCSTRWIPHENRIASNWSTMMSIFGVWSNRHGYSTSTWFDSH